VTRERFSGAGFLRTYALPALVLLLIPGVGLWFASHASQRVESSMHRDVTEAITSHPAETAEEQAQVLAAYASMPGSVMCAPGSPLAAPFAHGCSALAQFGWIRRISQASIAVGLLAFLCALVSVGTSLASQRALYASFLAGWNILKVAALVQAVGQGIVMVMLSYWMTVVWFDRYVPKLILLVGIAGLVAVGLIVKAIFKAIDGTPQLEGTLLTEKMAPRFWTHVREMCKKLETDPPSHIVAGVDDNFFVTEHPVMLGDTRLEGRTLFVSFSLLKVMERQEADGVLAHEMAHFSGDDTLYSRKMSPLLARYSEYLGALYQGGWLVRPVFYFMLLFWALFQMSISRMSRQREFRADAVAAGATSPAAMGRALVKVMAYSSYRSRIEQALFSQDAQQEHVGIAGRVSAGFASYVASPNLLGDLQGTSFPHPFDSHPGLDARLAAIRAPLVPSHYPRMLTAPVSASWLADIEGSAEIEARMWQAYEERFSAAHEESLAWRLTPTGDEERAIVEKHFPAQTLSTKKSDATLDVDFARVSFSEWEAPVSYSAVTAWNARESWGRKILTLTLNTPARKKAEIPLHRFADADGVVALVHRYASRHAVMTQYQAEQSRRSA
jgi:Zn-dependent protease with chaperone function